MSSIAYYEQLISESYSKIRNYEKQIAELKDFSKENQKGVDEFTAKNNERRRTITNSLSQYLRHPMVSRLQTRLSTAIDNSYENNVLNNFQAVDDEIKSAIRKLEGQIEDDNYHISYYSGRISEIEEEERKAAEEIRISEERKAEAAKSK